MKADPKVVADLQTTGGILATMAEQYRVDKKILKRGGLRILAEMVGGFYHGSEKHLGIVLKQITRFDTDPQYGIGGLKGGADFAAILTRQLQDALGVLDQLCLFRTRAWDIRADYVPDIYEHAIEFVADLVADLEEQTRLIAAIGKQAYLSGQMED